MLAAAEIAELRFAGRVMAPVPTWALVIRAPTFHASKFPAVAQNTFPRASLSHLLSDQRTISALLLRAVAEVPDECIPQPLPTMTDQFRAPRVRRLPLWSFRYRAAEC